MMCSKIAQSKNTVNPSGIKMSNSDWNPNAQNT